MNCMLNISFAAFPELVISCAKVLELATVLEIFELVLVI